MLLRRIFFWWFWLQKPGSFWWELWVSLKFLFSLVCMSLTFCCCADNIYSYKQQKPMQKLQFIWAQSGHISRCSTQTVDSHNGQCSVCLQCRRAGHFWQATMSFVANAFFRQPLISLQVSLDSRRQCATSRSGRYWMTAVRTLSVGLNAFHIHIRHIRHIS